mmetsp:Transcript_55469/g.110249  ORF Transcript_55469/g.110249 Transcript_55469/m.110249 type:complete len:988 (-) Transcript_55469:352-3315(-)
MHGDNTNTATVLPINATSDGGSEKAPKKMPSQLSLNTTLSSPKSHRTSVASMQGPKQKWWARCSNKIVENKYVVFFTTILTFWALIGDDLRLIYSTKNENMFFDWLVVATMFCFTVELILSCLGKQDYFMGFFFWLDLISTFSLLLDISIISKWLTDLLSGGDEGATTIRSGRSARLGARLGRILRVLRLIRVLKLYKAYYENKRRQKKLLDEEREFRASGAMVPWRLKELQKKQPGEVEVIQQEVFVDENPEAMEDTSESNVGRALSEQTTRKTILLILLMLLVLPLLSVEVGDQVATSAEYGANGVFDTLQNARSPPADANTSGLDYSAIYQQTLLRYVFYHNWFAGQHADKFCPQTDGGRCTAGQTTHLFWIGVRSKDESTANRIANEATLNPTQVDVFLNEQAQVDPGSSFIFGNMASEAISILKEPWKVSCDMKSNKLRGFSLLAQQIPGVVETTVTCPDSLRDVEIGIYFPQTLTESQIEDWSLIFFFDQRRHVMIDSTFNLITVAFILFLLLLGATMFSADADRLVVLPVEKMIRNVVRIRKDPLVATIMADEEFRKEEDRKARLRASRGSRLWAFLSDLITCQVCMKDRKEPMETVILEKTIIKLGSLLALGLGEAGANIIRSNIAGSESVMINAMVPGVPVKCVVGVVRVVDFGIATEVLQAQVNTFANRIAEIVHGVCDEFHGAPNKNNGDTFLIIWRMDYNERSEMVCRYAEMALLAFTKVQGAVHRSPLLAGYRTHPGLQFRLGTRCRVSLSMSLHAGWAIEGAVGSEFKIDASYLSPHVRMAQDMEAVIESYGVPMVVSQQVIKLCNAQLAQHCRKIDVLRIKGIQDAIELYALDLDCKQVQVDASMKAVVWDLEKRFRARKFIASQKSANRRIDTNLAKVFETDPTIIAMRKPYTQHFFEIFKAGLLNYIQGEWQVARNKLEETRNMLEGEDGPSAALLAYMKEESGETYEKPVWWKGVHEPPGGPEGEQQED